MVFANKSISFFQKCNRTQRTDLIDGNAAWVTNKDKKALQDCCAQINSGKETLHSVQNALKKLQKAIDGVTSSMEQVCQGTI